MRSELRNGDRDYLARSFEILRSVSRHPSRSLGVIARETGIPKTTVHRIVSNLTAVGAVVKSGDSIRLGLVMFELGARVPQGRLIRDVSLPLMQHLRFATASDVNLAVLRGYEVIYLERIAGPVGNALPGGIGLRLPALYTGVGKALLAYESPAELDRLIGIMPPAMTEHSLVHEAAIRQEMREVRRVGLAHDTEESRLGVVCVASPILVHGRAVAGISVSSPKGSQSNAAETAVRMAARSIGQQLSTGWRLAAMLADAH